MNVISKDGKLNPKISLVYTHGISILKDIPLLYMDLEDVFPENINKEYFLRKMSEVLKDKTPFGIKQIIVLNHNYTFDSVLCLLQTHYYQKSNICTAIAGYGYVILYDHKKHKLFAIDQTFCTELTK